MAIKGSCLCGSVTFEIDRAVGPFEICHCNRCRKVSGSQNISAVGVNTADFRMLSGKFTSTNILEKYEDEFNEPVKLSVISTYLSRYSSKGRIDRVRTGREWTYQTIKISQKRR